MTVKLYRIILPVTNIERAAEFYGAVLGEAGQRVSKADIISAPATMALSWHVTIRWLMAMNWVMGGIITLPNMYIFQFVMSGKLKRSARRPEAKILHPMILSATRSPLCSLGLNSSASLSLSAQKIPLSRDWLTLENYISPRSRRMANHFSTLALCSASVLAKT